MIILKKFNLILQFCFCINEFFLAQIRAKLHIFLVVMVELKDRGLK
jgi:hypothetical protein